ncbi:hypothetical protein HJC23_011992 [Cyclotella cryptica]|uniref:RING-type domain-containing protein n=1 Tax=Cyclotella cryptica TaxID=29204 RepID=A0ABD3QQH8_9STRA|eukprot:CCRYP_003033-RA/>CCRYP_003033-RA protein AED:0.00 eAED:0.00 QI:62/1/1/1/0/0/2/1058/619
MSADCPICLSPLTSPWGVCHPCGHAYHRECWDALLCASHETSRKKKKKKCALCNCATDTFVQVYVDLGRDDADRDITNEDNGDNDGVNDDALDDLKKEWEDLRQELRALLLSNGSCLDDIQQAGDDQELIDTANGDYHGTQDIRDICATIDLTQSPRRSAAGMRDSGSQNPKQIERQKIGPQHEDTQPKPLQQQQLKQTKIQHLLSRLHQIHTTLMDLAPSSTSKQSSHLRSKFLALQQTNSTLESQIIDLQNENSTLQSKLNRANQSLFDRNLETEREKRQAETLNEKYTHLLGVYSSYQDRTMRQIEELKRSYGELKRKNEQLKTVSGLADVKEMEEIRRKYTKMSQQVHDLTKENQVLTRRMEEIERRRADYLSVKNLISSGVEKKNNVNSHRSRRNDNDADACRSVKYSTSWKVGDKENNFQHCRARSDIFSHAKHDSKGTVESDLSLPFSDTSANRAMQILDMAPSRKTVPKSMKVKSQLDQRRTNESYGNRSSAINRDFVRDIGRWDNDEDDCDSSEESKAEIQLFMKNPSRKHSRAVVRTSGVNDSYPTELKQSNTSLQVPLHRQGSVNSNQSATSQGKRKLLETSSASRKSSKKGTVSQTISTFFKPATSS